MTPMESKAVIVCPCCGQRVEISLCPAPGILLADQADAASLFGIELGLAKGGECNGQGEDSVDR